MNQDSFEIQKPLTTSRKVLNLYKNNKILIISISFIIFFLFVIFNLYLSKKENENLIFANEYVQAKVYVENNEKDKALKILNKLVLDSKSTYSVLAFFLILNENLIDDKEQLVKMFDHILNKNKFDTEIKNLIIFKKALFQSDFTNEEKLLSTLKPLINSESIWKPHALLLLGDYFVQRKEFLKAKEFYLQVLSIKNIDQEFYKTANSKLSLIKNE